MRRKDPNDTVTPLFFKTCNYLKQYLILEGSEMEIRRQSQLPLHFTWILDLLVLLRLQNYMQENFVRMFSPWSVFVPCLHCLIYYIIPILSCVLFLSLPGLSLNYPEGSVLLDTRLRHGEVSDDARDVVHREDGWQVPEGYRDHLRSMHAAETNLRVKFVVRQNQLTTIIIRNWFGPLLGGCCTILWALTKAKFFNKFSLATQK